MRAIIVPVKAFRDAKHRLTPALGEDDRSRLARLLAHRVLAARGVAPAFVACDDDEVADFVLGEGATVLWTPGLGLSGAVDAAVAYLGHLGFTLAVVAHADLPLAHSLDRFGKLDEVTIAPDRRLDGSNVVAVPTMSGFSFSYGPRSYVRHCETARGLGIRCRSVFDWRLASDVDLPDDLRLVAELLT